ncbi:MAG: penicillin-binding protein activator [Magnetococcus sp. XQGC-1]
MVLLCVGGLLWGCVGQRPLDRPAPLIQPARSAPQQPAAKGSAVAEPVRTSAPKKKERQVETRRTESPEEATLLQGELLLSQGMLPAAWHQWSSVAQGSDAPAGAVYEDAAWRRLFETYFKQGNADNTPHFLHEIAAIEPTASQNRLLQELLNRQSRERLTALLQGQPAQSPLIPLLQQALANPSLPTGVATAPLAPPLPGSMLDAEPPTMQSMQPEQPMQPAQSVQAEPAPPLPAQPLPEERVGGELRVGLLLPLSGKWTNMGEHLRRAAKKALADYPAVPIQLLIADSGDTGESSQKGIQELLAQQVDVVVGPVFYPTVQPAVEAAAAKQVPIITLNPQRESDQSSPGVFSNAFQPEQQAKIMARYAVLEKKFARVAILAPDSEYGRSVAKTFADELRAQGGTLARISHFPQDTNDFSSFLKGLGPHDALFLPAPAKQVRLIAPQAALFRGGKGSVTLLGTSLWNSSELLSEGTDYMEGAVFCDIDPAVKEQFRQSFRQTWEEEPSALATLAYDGVAVVAQVRQAQQQGGIPWQEAITQKAAFQGASGPVRFLANGQSRRLYHLFLVEKGKMRPLQPFQDSLAIP